MEEAVEELKAEMEGEGKVVDVAKKENVDQLLPQIGDVPLNVLFLTVHQI